MADLWLMSDWHYAHENIYKFTYTKPDGTQARVRERFSCAREGDEFMMQAWAERVKAPDHLWFLGDFVMWEGNHRADEFVRLVRSLPGHKRITPGNHDKLNMRHYIDAGFEKIRATNNLNGILLSHYPIHPDHFGNRVVGQAHGHIHQNPSPAGRYYNACVEVNDFAPVHFDTVMTALREAKGVGTDGTD